MGDPRKHRKKYETPRHPWQRERIDSEKKLVKTHGLKKKKEIWQMEAHIRKFKRQAKLLTTRTDDQAKKEQELLLKKLYNLGILEQDAKLENILDLSTTDILNRRLQTVMVNSGLAHTAKQARQFIVHRHVTVDNQKVTIPSYLLTRQEENKISFGKTSALADPEHAARVKKEKEAPIKEKPKEEKKAEEKEKKEQQKPEIKEQPIPEEKAKEEEPLQPTP